MDNYYTQCPPKMEDGRFLTDYRTATTREEANKKAVAIVRDDEYRQYLQTKASSLVANDRKMSKTGTCKASASCVHNYPTRMTNRMFIDQMNAYNNQSINNVSYMCESFPDYDATTM